MAYIIDQEHCINCWWCRRECPTETIHYFDQPNRKHWIDPADCIDCDICVQVCPMDCITHDPSYTPDPERLEQAKERARQWARGRRQGREAIRGYAESQVLRLAGSR